MSIPLYKLADLLLAQKGDKYVFGSEANRTDPNPEAFDCSELIEWGMESLGFGDFPDGSMNQRAFCEREGKKLTVSTAIHLRGALLFRDISVNGVGHVALSLGNGKTIEARGSDYGVGVFSATEGRVWTSGATIPGLDYTAVHSPPEKVDRWVCFGRYGGRYGHSSTLAGLHKHIKEAESRTDAAVVIYRKEPKNLAKVSKDYPRWKAEKVRPS